MRTWLSRSDLNTFLELLLPRKFGCFASAKNSWKSHTSFRCTFTFAMWSAMSCDSRGAKFMPVAPNIYPLTTYAILHLTACCLSITASNLIEYLTTRTSAKLFSASRKGFLIKLIFFPRMDSPPPLRFCPSCFLDLTSTFVHY